MPASQHFVDYALEQLSDVGIVTARRMFGGAGIYCQGVIFGLVADDVLYFKVDDRNRGDFEAAGMQPFKPFADKASTMQYYEVPGEVLEAREQLRAWADKALAAARSKRRAKQAGSTGRREATNRGNARRVSQKKSKP